MPKFDLVSSPLPLMRNQRSEPALRRRAIVSLESMADAAISERAKTLLEQLEAAEPLPFHTKQPIQLPLSEKAQRVLTAMRGISASDSLAKEQAQALLWELEGERCTARLIRELKRLLKSKGWRPRCLCAQGAPGTLGWASRPDCRYGGRMYLSHHNLQGAWVMHLWTAEFPRLNLE